MKRPKPLAIGWQEWAALPSFGVDRIKAKIDTGAKTSAIHAYRIREVRHEGVSYAEFFLHPIEKMRRPEIFCAAPIIDRRAIRSSNGAIQTRLVVRTKLRLADRVWSIELSLANRDAMGFRFLIGRDALKSNVVIYPSRSFLLCD